MSASELEKLMMNIEEKMREELVNRLEELLGIEDKPLDELSHDDLVPLIIDNYDNPDKLYEITHAITVSKVLTEEEKEHLYNLIDNPP